MLAEQAGRVTIRRRAMATEFSITIAHADHRYASQAAGEALQELDRLENCLSAFRSDSDLSRIARLQPGATCVVDPDTLDCLRIALDMERFTDGAFDVAYRSQPRRRASQLIRLGDHEPTVTALHGSVVLDLGGIGKGFALDHMARWLAEWDLHCVLLRASKSTVLALSPPPGCAGWEVRFGTGSDSRALTLARLAVSGSGSDLKGPHIIDPRTDRPVLHHRLAFATAASGAEADAMSTAFVVMTDQAVQDFCRGHGGTAAYVVSAGQETLHVLQEVRRPTAVSFSQ